MNSYCGIYAVEFPFVHSNILDYVDNFKALNH